MIHNPPSRSMPTRSSRNTRILVKRGVFLGPPVLQHLGFGGSVPLANLSR
jgi:hypothetical protein